MNRTVVQREACPRLSSSKKIEVFTDGACSGNPGPAGIGVVIQREGAVIREVSRSLPAATNNVAEYMAVICALEEALQLQADDVTVNTDSELLFNQLRGAYKVKNENLKPLHDQIRILAKGIKALKFRQIGRDHNQHADRLAKRAVIKEQAKVVTSEFNFGEESPSSQG